jgi:hypothetical protein
LSNDSDVVYEGSVHAENAEGVTFVKKGNGKAVYELTSGTYAFGLNVPISTDNKSVYQKKNVLIYPNPVHNILNIAIEPSEYSIFDLTGRKVKTGNGVLVNVSNLIEGVYFIHVGNNVSKFVKN